MAGMQARKDTRTSCLTSLVMDGRGVVCGLPCCIPMVSRALEQKPGRFERGIRNPKPEKLAALQALREQDPTITRGELGRRVGLSKAAVTYYLRHLDDALDDAKRTDPELRHQLASRQVELASGVSKLVRRTEREVYDLLDRDSKDLTARGVAARMITAYARLAQLEAQLTAPPRNAQTNIHINQLQALALAPLNRAVLSAESQAVLGRPDDANTGTSPR